MGEGRKEDEGSSEGGGGRNEDGRGGGLEMQEGLREG